MTMRYDVTRRMSHVHNYIVIQILVWKHNEKHSCGACGYSFWLTQSHDDVPNQLRGSCCLMVPFWNTSSKIIQKLQKDIKKIKQITYLKQRLGPLRNLFGNNKASTSEAKSRMDASWLLMLSSGNVPSVKHENSTWCRICEFVQPSLPAIEGALGLAVHRGHVRVSRLDCLSGNLEILVHGIRFQALCCLQTHVHPILASEMDSRWIRTRHTESVAPCRFFP